MLRLSLSLMFLAAAGGPSATSPAAASSDPFVSRARYLMGTVCEGTVVPPGDGSAREEAAAALEAAFDEIARLEQILSDYKQDSELSRLNREGYPGPFACSGELYSFLETSARYSRLTGGAFDVTVAPLVTAWDLRGRGRQPDPQALASARARTGADKLLLDPAARSARFAVPGMGLDPGAIGKGYALDAAAEILRRRGVTSALLNFGGQLLALGAPPGARGWEASIAHPVERSLEATHLSLRDASISTSGCSVQSVVVGNRRLGHILDPKTGSPLTTQSSASVLAPTATQADALSTALLVMGPEAGLRWAEQHPDVTVVFMEVDPKGELRIRRSDDPNHQAPSRKPRGGVNPSRGER